MAATQGREASGRWALMEPPQDRPVRKRSKAELKIAMAPSVARAAEYSLFWLSILWPF